MPVHQVGKPEHHLLAIKGSEFAPWPLEGSPRSCDGTVNVHGAALRNFGQHFAGGRVEGLEGLPRQCRHGLAVDQHQLDTM
ncbi:hypothetical protein D3C87_1831560 [compost metagenome]